MLDHAIRPLNAKTPVRLCERYAGRVLLIVNTASECVYTPQYAELVELSIRYGEGGLVVLGMPSNDFGNQEPGTEARIARFCRAKFNVNFPMFEKLRVVGTNAHPLYRALAAASGEAPRWNFHKYLIGRNGQLIGSFASHVPPSHPQLVAAIENALSAATPARMLMLSSDLTATY